LLQAFLHNALKTCWNIQRIPAGTKRRFQERRHRYLSSYYSGRAAVAYEKLMFQFGMKIP